MSNLLSQASLVMIPSGYKEDVVYSPIPTTGAGDLSFTRASDGTRVNSAGLVEVVAWNMLEYSEDFSNGLWVKTNTTVSTNTTTAPNGTTTADSLLETTANATHQLWQRPVMVAGQTFTQSCYIKTNGRNRVQLQIFDSSALYVGALFDVVSGTIIATNGTSSIESVGNGWYRCIVSGVCPTSTTGYCVVNLATDSYTQASAQDSYTGDASKGIFIWGAQTNIGATAKPYFPTTDRLNVPRLTYQNGGGGCPSLLLEKQSTNLFTYSEQFDNAGWQKNDGTITANATTSPDGTQNADKSIPSTTNSDDHIVRQTISVTNGTDYTFSIYAKNGGYNFVLLNGANGSGVKVNLTDGSKTEYSSPTSTKVENLGNGWYRISITATANSTIYAATINIQNSATPQYPTWSGNGTDGVFLWGLQLEASSYPTSYIPTTSASATRVADACSKTGISSLIGQTSGTILWDLQIDELLPSENILNIDNGSFGNTIYFLKTTSNAIIVDVYASSVQQCFLSYALPSVGRYKVAFAYASNDFAFYVNGVSRGTDSSGSVPTCSRLQLGSGALGASDGKVNELVLFPTRLTNAELASLTTI